MTDFSCSAPQCGTTMRCRFITQAVEGRPFTIAGIDIYRVADGQLCEHWHVIDQLGMLGQLRLLPQGAEGSRFSAAPIDARASAAGSLASINA